MIIASMSLPRPILLYHVSTFLERDTQKNLVNSFFLFLDIAGFLQDDNFDPTNTSQFSEFQTSTQNQLQLAVT
jgi:hypothetical protein